MAPSDPISRGETKAGPGWFATTHWSLILAAGRSPTPRSAAALETLCETYWPPRYAYARRKGHSAEDAEDLVQGLFALLLEREDLQHVAPERGKFRSFLLASLNHYISNERDRARAKKRGGDRLILSLDAQREEEGYLQEPADNLTPEKVFERRWALTLLERAFARLRDEHEVKGKSEFFDSIQPYLVASEDRAPYKEAAEKLGMSEGSLKVAIHRMRRRFRDALRDEVAQTVTNEKEIEEEIRYLLTVLGS